MSGHGRSRIIREAEQRGWTVVGIEWGRLLNDSAGTWTVEIERGDEDRVLVGYNADEVIARLPEAERNG